METDVTPMTVKFSDLKLVNVPPLLLHESVGRTLDYRSGEELPILSSLSDLSFVDLTLLMTMIS